MILFNAVFLWEALFLNPLKRVFSKFDRQYYTEGVVGFPRIINPLISTSEAEKDINELVFNSLVKIDSSGEVKPELAEKFSLTGDREYILSLRKGFSWHDGKPFKAIDVVYTIGIIQDPSYKSIFQEALKDVSLEQIDDYTVKFKLKEPFAPFLSTLNFGIIPAHVPFNQYRPIGTGVFRVKSIDSKKIVLTKGWLDLILKFYPDYQSAINALKIGEIQGFGGLNADELEELAKWPRFKAYSQPMYRRVVLLHFNLKSNLLGEKPLRQALRYSVPKDKIIKEVTRSRAVKAIGPIQPNSWGIKETKDYDYNLPQAQSLLEKAGWKKENSHWIKDGRELKLSLSFPESPLLREAAKRITKSWQELGIITEERSYDAIHFKEQVVFPKNFEVVLTSQELTADPDQYVLWHSTQSLGGNIASLSSPKVDKVLEDGRKILKLEDRRERYWDFQKYINDEVPAVFLYYPSYNYLVSSRIKGLDFNDFDIPSDRFNSSLYWRLEKRFF